MSAANAQSFDFESPDDQIEFVLSLVARHPGMPDANREFKRNSLETIDEAVRFAKSKKMARFFWNDQSYQAIAAYSAIPVEYDEKALREVKALLREDAQTLSTFQLSTLENDLNSFRQNRPFDEKKFSKDFSRMLRLAPLLYSSDGSAQIKEAREFDLKIQTVTPSQLENLYLDLFSLHLKPLFLKAIGSDMIALKILAAFEREFMGKLLIRATTQKSTDGRVAEVRKLSIEMVPPAVALYRGNFGGDCSILSVPYYVLSPDVSVYFIRKSASFEAQPSGYMLVTTAEVNGVKVHYVLTVNGVTLTEADMRVAIDLMLQHQGADQVLFPDFELAPHVVNTEAAKAALSSENSTRVEAVLPKSWESFEYFKPKYSNYYARELLSSAHLVKSSELSKPFISQYSHKYVQNPYQRVEVPHSVLKRMILADELLANAESDVLTRRLLKKFAITPTQMQIFQAWRRNPTIEKFIKARKSFGLSLSDLSIFQGLTSLEILAPLAVAYGEDEIWKKMTAETTRKFETKLLKMDDETFKLNIFKFLGLKAELPYEFRQISQAIIDRAFNIVLSDWGHIWVTSIFSDFEAVLPFILDSDSTATDLFANSSKTRLEWIQAFLSDISELRNSSLGRIYRTLAARKQSQALAAELLSNAHREAMRSDNAFQICNDFSELKQFPDVVEKVKDEFEMGSRGLYGDRASRLFAAISLGVQSDLIIPSLLRALKGVRRTVGLGAIQQQALNILKALPIEYRSQLQSHIMDLEVDSFHPEIRSELRKLRQSKLQERRKDLRPLCDSIFHH